MGFGVTGIIQNLGGIDGGSISDKDLYGTKPVVPGAVDYTQALKDSIASNMAILPSLRQLGLASTDIFSQMQEKALPGYTGLRDSITGTLAEKAKGQIPRDVLAMLERNSAEKGVALGTSGSQNNQFDELRNLGLTSLAIQNEAIQQTNSWFSQNRGNAFDFTKMFLGKDDAIRRTEFNWQRDWLANQIKAAPDPQKRGAYDAEMGFLGEVLSVYSGGAGYQQTYRQPGYSNPGGGGGGGYSPSGNPWGSDYGHESYFGGSSGLPQGQGQGGNPNAGTGE